MSRRLLNGSALVLAVGLSAWLPADIRSAGPRSGSETLIVDVGDVVRVKGGVVGCRVTRRAGFPDQKILDCRRAGALPGTLGVFFGDRKLLVVRFRAGDTAKVVFTGTHEGDSRTCRG